METKRTEGWGWLINSPKWHYLRNGTSLCGRFMVLGRPELVQGNDTSPDNCQKCRTRLEKEKARETKG